ncbi:hypothetical protein [Deinococcus sp.]|uniref:hypothetical protein n=1 Tax=Deinococcus sp. TaxID=47478 RepID=UPI0025FB56D1|nr:hypothetical protein [Deinococcus sp.]
MTSSLALSGLALSGLALSGLAQGAAVLEGRSLNFELNGKPVGSARFPAVLGDISGPVAQNDTTWLAVGPALYGFTARGVVRTRLEFSNVIGGLDGSGGLLRVTAGPSGAQDSYTVSRDRIQERVVFVPDKAVTNWLAQAAALVPETALKAAVAQDPTNPFLALRYAAQANARGDTVTALAETQRAASLEVPFPAALSLASRFEMLGNPAAANLQLSRAARDYAERGYDPALPVSRAALNAYGDPLGEVEILLSRSNLDRADVWIRYLRQVSPRFEGAAALYRRYAELLGAQGRSGEAEEWRAYAASLVGGTVYNLGEFSLLTLRDAARLCALVLLISVCAAYLTLSARAWRVQGQGTAALGGRYLSWLRHPLSRLRRSVLAYAGLGEKLIAVALLSGLLVSLSAWTWAAQTQARLQAPALGIGTYGGAWFYGGLDGLELRPGGGAALLRGLAAQLDGDEAAARSLYQAGDAPLPCSQNNLGVLAQNRGDSVQARELWRASLSAAPDLSAPAYNLGLQPGDPEASFQRLYRTTPRLCYPDQRSLVQAQGGSLAGQLRMLVFNPWRTLMATPTTFSGPVQGAWALLLLLAYVLCLLWLLTPIPEEARRTGRPALFRALALLLPGSALLDGAWGVVLLLGWAAAIGVLLIGRGAVRVPYLPGPLSMGVVLALLVVVYALNTLGVALQEVGHRRGRRAALDGGLGGR